MTTLNALGRLLHDADWHDERRQCKPYVRGYRTKGRQTRWALWLFRDGRYRRVGTVKSYREAECFIGRAG